MHSPSRRQVPTACRSEGTVQPRRASALAALLTACLVAGGLTLASAGAWSPAHAQSTTPPPPVGLSPAGTPINPGAGGSQGQTSPSGNGTPGAPYAQRNGARAAANPADAGTRAAGSATGSNGKPAAKRTAAEQEVIDEANAEAGAAVTTPSTAKDYKRMERDTARPTMGQLQDAWNHPVAAPGQTSPGIIEFDYDRRVMRLRARAFMFTTVVLPPCETIDDVYIGDPGVFRVAQERDNVITIYPKRPGADTDIHLVSANGTHYDFYVRSEDIAAGDISDLAAYVNNYAQCGSRGYDRPAGRLGGGGPLPGQARIAANSASMPVTGAGSRSKQSNDYARSIPFDLATLNFTDYAILIQEERDKAIAPARVFHDDQFVYIDYGARADQISWPAVFLTEDGIDTPVNARVTGDKGQILVVESLGNITLKSGDEIVCLRRRDSLPTGGARTASSQPLEER